MVLQDNSARAYTPFQRERHLECSTIPCERDFSVSSGCVIIDPTTAPIAAPCHPPPHSLPAQTPAAKPAFRIVLKKAPLNKFSNVTVPPVIFNILPHSIGTSMMDWQTPATAPARIGLERYGLLMSIVCQNTMRIGITPHSLYPTPLYTQLSGRVKLCPVCIRVLNESIGCVQATSAKADTEAAIVAVCIL
jgi:hypothetical protein